MMMCGQKSRLLLACLLVLLLGATGAFAIHNDNRGGPEHVGDVTDLHFTTIGAHFDGPGLCMNGPNIWYRYTASCTGQATVSLLGSSFDTMLAVYDCPGYNPTIDQMIGCNDDAEGSYQSQLTFDVVAGRNTYLIEVGGYGTNAGAGVLNITCGTPEPPSPPPATKDDCAHATSVGDVTDLAFDTTNATFDGPGLCMTGPNVWYVYTASCTGEATVSLLGSDYDTMLAVYNGADCNPTAGDMIGCNDDVAGSYQSELTFDATSGQQYLIEVGGYGSATGQGVISISCEGTEPPPATKDDCAHATLVGDVTDLAFDTTNATFDGPGLCMTGPNVWYIYTASCTGEATVSLLGSAYDTMLAVYNGGDCYPTAGDMIGCNDDVAGSYQSELTFDATSGQQYLIEVGGYGSATGQGVISISCEGTEPPPAAKDDCAHATALSEVKDLAFDTTNATFDGLGLCMTSPNIWYCYTASCSGEATVSLLGSAYDTMLAVYNGCGCDLKSENLIVCNDDAEGTYQSQATFTVVAGGKYLIEIGGYGSQTGEGVLNIRCEQQIPSEPFDLGDAPDSSNNRGRTMTAYPAQGFLPAIVPARFPTVYDDGSGTGPYGPLHRRAGEVACLGLTTTWETEADSGQDQDGQFNIQPRSDSADHDGGDDGVVFPISFPSGRRSTFDYSVNVIEPGTDLWVNVWCDWNRDGDWDDVIDTPQGSVPEWAVQNQFLFDLPAGLTRLTTPAVLAWHPADGRTRLWMRITLSAQPWKGGSNPGEEGNGGSGPEGGYEIGETEDYFFFPDTSQSVCQDFNGDGEINTEDLVLFTTMWLDNCPN
ncbi:MAG: GEVED domain-containing protein [Sedimentisphaerales bacterium]